MEAFRGRALRSQKQNSLNFFTNPNASQQQQLFL